MNPGFPVPVIGLTGGIASGKSLAARVLREKAGIPVLDADQISRDLSRPEGLAAPSILAAFGTLDRAQLRKKVFSDPAARATLEAILHPLIREETTREIQDLARAGATLVFYEASLLVETGRFRDFDALLVIEAAKDTRVARLMERDSCTREMAEAILDAQTTDQQRRDAATWIIENSGTIDDLAGQILNLLPQMMEHVRRSH